MMVVSLLDERGPQIDLVWPDCDVTRRRNAMSAERRGGGETCPWLPIEVLVLKTAIKNSKANRSSADNILPTAI